MLDELSARVVSGICVERLDWTIIGDEGGTVTIFTGEARYHAAYGTEGGDPTRENSTTPLPEHSDLFKRYASADHPIICTVIVRDGVAETDVRHLTAMDGAEAYEDVANLELDRKIIHDEVPEGSWLKDPGEAWSGFHDQIDDMDECASVFELSAWTLELVFALSECRETHYRYRISLSVKVLPEDARQVRLGIPDKKEIGKWWDVRARSWDSRYIVCTRRQSSPIHRFRYAVIDRKRNVLVVGAGPDNRGEHGDKECEELIRRLSDLNDTTLFDPRNCLRLRIVEYR